MKSWPWTTVQQPKMCDAAKKHAMKSHPDALIPAWNDLLRQAIQSARTT